MATPKLNLPTITGNETADVPRDFNALANAIESKAGAADGLATLGPDGKVPSGQVNVDLKPIEQALETHQADLVSQEVGKGADIIGLPDPNSLFTATSVGGAMQELFTNANNGKTDIASVIGSPATSGDSFSQLKTHIQNRKNELATNLSTKGQASAGTETLDALVDKVALVYTGKKFAVGTVTGNSNFPSKAIITGLGFTPSIFLTTGAVGSIMFSTKNLTFNNVTLVVSANNNGSTQSTNYIKNGIVWGANGVTLENGTVSNGASYQWMLIE